ncbi:MAG: PEP-CTERM sorting domain-containing protein [Candidatus Sulfopaludibacter sp.]|nr:PEP-CTERM sorting domain-containing protein [Candidatus Sulfopaludibacter sp.]
MSTHNPSLRGVLHLLVAAALGSVAAHASILNYYVDVFANGALGTTTATTTNPASASQLGPGTSASVLIPKLNQLSDPNPGEMYILTGVQLTLSWVSSGTVQVSNLDCLFGIGSCPPVDIPFTSASSNVPLTLTLGGVTVNAPGVAGPVSGTAKNSTDGGPVNSFAGQHGSGSTGNPVGNLALFEGFGNSTISGNVSNGSQAYSGTAGAGYPPALSFGGTSTTGAVLQVQYTYTQAQIPVPEPTSMALIGSAMLGFGLLLRRRAIKR